jgi:NADH:ubiquinone reductase (non-electrogenic)
LRSWYPELADSIRITLVEALPSVLPMFSKQLIDYTESTFKQAKIDIMTKTMVKEVKEKSVVLQMPDKSTQEVPCGMVVWAAVRALFISWRLSRMGLTRERHRATRSVV